MESDAELVRKTLREGNQHFAPLAQRYSDYLFGLAMRLTLGNRPLSEDICQQALLRSFTYLRSFDQRKTFKHWITGITVNCYKDLIRQEKKDQPLLSVDEPSYAPDLNGNREFFELIAPLNDEEKALFVLRFIYEYQVNEIAELLGMKIGTVKSKLSRSMAKLQS